MEGPGVGQVKHRDIDRLGDKFIEIRDEKAALATKLGETEKAIVDKMVEKGLTKYTFGDQEVIVKPGKNHIRIRTIKVEGAEANGAEPEAE